MIELAADDEINGRFPQRLLRLHGYWRSDEGDFQLRVRILHHLCNFHVDIEAWCRGEQHEQLEVFGHRDGLLNGYLMRWRVYDLAVSEHASRIAEPNRIPV